MNCKKTWFLAGCFVFGPIVGNLAAADEVNANRPQTGQLDSAKGSHAVNANLIRAKDLIGKSVKNEEGKDIGEIQDVIVDSKQGRIAYAVLQFGGFLGFGEKQFAIPFQALSEDAARQNLILNVKKEKLEAARGFEKNKWPDMGNEEWARDTHKHYGYDNYWEKQNRKTRDKSDGTRTEDTRTEGTRTEDVKSDDTTRDQRDLREREQREQREQRESLPRPNSTDPTQTPQPDGSEAKVIQAPSQTTTSRTDTTRSTDQDNDTYRPQLDRQHFWSNRVSQMFGKPVVNNAGESLGKVSDLMVDMKHGRIVYAILTDGGTLGISENLTAVPASALKVDAAKEQYTLNASEDELKAQSFKESAWPNMSDIHWGRSNHEAFKQQPYWSTSSSNGEKMDAAWLADSEYNKGFNAQKAQTITGKVTSISEYCPSAKDGSKGRAVVITNNAGQTFDVHLGPVSYLDRKEDALVLKEGDTVTILGSTGKFEGKDTIQANEVRRDNRQAYPLRNSQGRARWDREEDQSTTPTSAPTTPTRDRDNQNRSDDNNDSNRNDSNNNRNNNDKPSVIR